MYRRVKKQKEPTGEVAAPRQGLLSEKRAVLADIGFRVKQDAQGEGVDAVVDLKTDVAFSPTARLTTMDESRQKALSLHWEEITYATARLVQETLTAPLPAPWLSPPTIGEVEATKHWTEQRHEDQTKRGYGLKTFRLPRTADAETEHCELLASPNVENASRLVVLVPGGSCPLAVWNRNLLLQGPIAKGSVIDAVDQILQVFNGAGSTRKSTDVPSWESIDTAIIIANPGERFWTTADGTRAGRAVTSEYAQFRQSFKLISDLASAENHISALLRDYVLPSRATKVHFMVASGSSSAFVACLAEHFKSLRARVCSIGLLQPQHHITQLTSVEGFAEWFRGRSLAIIMAKEDSGHEETHQELIARADRDAAESGGQDEPSPDLSKGCLVLASPATKIDLLVLKGPARLASFAKFLDEGRDLSPLLAQVDELAALEMARAERQAAVTTNGLQGWS